MHTKLDIHIGCAVVQMMYLLKKQKAGILTALSGIVLNLQRW